MSLSDPLTLLREHTINKKPITLTADHVVFGTTRFARSALTAYRERNGAGEYYPTASLAFLLQNRADSHPVFVRKCGQENIKAVTFTDRRQLLQYLDGQLETCAAVDYEKYERPQPEEVSDEAAAEPGKVDEEAMVIDEEDEAERVEAQARKELELAAAKEAFAQMLQDPKGSSAKILDGFKKRNQMALEAEEKRKRLSSTQPASGSRAMPSQAPPPGVPAPLKKPGEAVVGVIVVPAAVTAMVNMWNVRELLEDFPKFTPALEKKQEGKPKETSIKVKHTFEDGSTAQFLVTDAPLKLPASGMGPQWANVAAVFVQGQAWQFKDWPIKTVVEIFEQIAGYYIRFADEVPNQMVKMWNCQKLVFSKVKSKAHEVGVLMASFWASLHVFLMKHKPHLLQRPASVM